MTEQESIQASKQAQFNLDEIKAFFTFLDPTPEQYFTCAFLDAESNDSISGYGTKFAKVSTILATLDSLKAVQPTLHVTLNQTNHNGRRKEHIIASRVLCVDLDKYVTVDEIKRIKAEFSPHCIVKSSQQISGANAGAKYHLYWKIESLELDVWSRFQLGLAQFFGGDKTLDGIAKTIRVPGVLRTCKDGSQQMPEIMFLPENIKPLGIEDLVQLFPWYDTEHRKAKIEKELERERLRTEWKALNKGLKKGEKAEINPKETGRNSALWHEIYGALVRQEIESTEEAALVHANVLNESFGQDCGGALAASEVETIVESAVRTAAGKIEEKREKAAKKLADSKALLEKIEEIAKTPTNGFAGIYEYDYSKGSLQENRFTTLATVDRVLQRYGSYICKVDDILFAFDAEERIWRKQSKRLDIINDFVATCIRDIYRDAEFCSYFGGDKLKGAVEKFSSHSFTSGVQQQVCLSSKIKRYKSSDFDSNTNLVFCGNGVVDLQNGDLRQAKPEDMMLHRSGVNYEPTAKCERWIKFIREVFSDNDEPEAMVKFMQKLFGYSLTGGIEAQKIFIHFGSGSNGKSKVLQALDMLLGDYSTLMDGKAFTTGVKGFAQELERVGARIVGKRVVIVDDLDTQAKWSEGIVKNLTGVKVISRKLYEEGTNSPNRAKFHIGCNERPIPESQNFGILRRMCIIPYPKQFEPSAEKELELQEMLEQELSGIFNWALEGRISLLRHGSLGEPSEVGQMIVEYRREHFTNEGVVDRLLAIPEGSSEHELNQKHWHTIEEVLEHVNDGLEKAGIADRYNLTTLGTLLKSRFKCEERRVQMNKTRCRLKFIVLKCLASENKDLLE